MFSSFTFAGAEKVTEHIPTIITLLSVQSCVKNLIVDQFFFNKFLTYWAVRFGYCIIYTLVIEQVNRY